MLKKKEVPIINAGSMADIAFLLLIFFLVTTTIQTDAGIHALLPPYEKDPTIIIKNQKNVFELQLNSQNELLVRGNRLPMTEAKQIKEQLKTFVMNYGKDPNASISPKLAVVRILNDNGTSYEAYITVYNQIKAAYNELWNERSNNIYGRSYEDLDGETQEKIRAVIPLVISEAEPTALVQL